LRSGAGVAHIQSLRIGYNEAFVNWVQNKQINSWPGEITISLSRKEVTYATTEIIQD
jgi:hypothetical protein